MADPRRADPHGCDQGRCRTAGGKVAIGNRASAAFTRTVFAGYPSPHGPNTTAAVARCGRFIAFSPVGGCDSLVGGLHRRPSHAGYHNDEQNHE